MVPNKQFIQLSICFKVKMLENFTLLRMVILMQVNKKIEIITGKLILLILDLVKSKRMLFIIKSIKSCRQKDKINNFQQLNLFQLM